MKTINILPKELIAKIAAGEVVDRPASVVKELVENALDAESTYIVVELQEAGIKKIVVRDDGKGMSEEDTLLSFQPHTTSKINSLDDLVRISSFGFRGEALSSIASVAKLTIKSRRHDDEYGTIVELSEGTLLQHTRGGIPPGTEITVSSLFASTPARKKFLKDERTELRAILDVMTQFALAFPQVRFAVSNNDKSLIEVYGGHSLPERIHVLMGEVIAEHCIPVQHENRYGKIHGYVGKPQIALSSRNHQYIFVNGRAVTHAPATRAVSEAFGNLIDPKTYPVFVMFLSVPADSLDVNIHPRKEEVAFAYPHEISKLVHEGISKTLEAHDLTYIIAPAGSTQHNKSMDYVLADTLRNLTNPWNVKELQADDIAQVHNTYLVAQTPKGLLLVDQHAAHERILFEQFKDTYLRASELQESVMLREARVFKLSPKDSQILEDNLEILQKVGFDIEEFGSTTYKLSAVPELYKSRDTSQLIAELLADLKEHKTIQDVDRHTERTLSYLACRTAIKAGDVLTPEERKRLVEKLLDAKTIYTCPHGRPTHIEVSLKELDRMFKRI